MCTNPSTYWYSKQKRNQYAIIDFEQRDQKFKALSSWRKSFVSKKHVQSKLGIHICSNQVYSSIKIQKKSIKYINYFNNFKLFLGKNIFLHSSVHHFENHRNNNHQRFILSSFSSRRIIIIAYTWQIVYNKN